MKKNKASKGLKNDSKNKIILGLFAGKKRKGLFFKISPC
jgi:hypothetical protein